MPPDPRARRQRTFKISDLYPKRDDGLCRCGCQARLTGRRTSWASDECSERAVEDFQIRKGDTGAIRTAVFRRDKGVCADCGMDTEAERAICLAWEPPDGAEPETWAREAALARLERQRQGFPSPALHPWWHADHILPVAHGGGGCGLEGFATRCVVCHKTKTARQARAAATTRQLALTEKRMLARRGRMPNTASEMAPVSCFNGAAPGQHHELPSMPAEGKSLDAPRPGP